MTSLQDILGSDGGPPTTEYIIQTVNGNDTANQRKFDRQFIARPVLRPYEELGRRWSTGFTDGTVNGWQRVGLRRQTIHLNWETEMSPSRGGP